MAIAVKRKHAEALCEQCPLFNNRCAPSDGPANAKYAIVSRSPGKYDVLTKKPMSSPASVKLIDHLLNMNGVKRGEVLITNTVLCQSDKPPKSAIEACRPRLEYELRNVDTVLVAGPEAASVLIGSGTIGSYRGYRINRDGRTYVATNNPALVLRDSSAFPNLVRDFKLALDPLPEPELPEIDWTNDVKEGRRWLGILLKSSYPLLTVDIETKGLRADADLVAIGFSASGDKAISFGERICSDGYTYKNFLQPLITRSGSEYLYHNGKFDVRNLRAHGINAKVDHDTLLLSWALDERSDEASVHSLDYLLMNELAWPHYEPKEVKDWKAKVGKLEREFRFDELSELPTPESLYEYNALDVAGTAQLFPILREKAQRDQVYDLYRNHLLRASESLTKIELVGLNYDSERALDILEEEVWPKLQTLETELQTIIGRKDYNPRSNKQNSELVYDEWEISHDLRIENARSVADAVYTAIKEGRFHTANKLYRSVAQKWATEFDEFQTWDKQRSTYLESLILRAVHNEGKLYTDLKLHNTSTGRLSSSKPNLQNITRSKPELPNIRSLFVAEDGCQLVSADYSQAELRCIAELSGSTNLGAIYRNRLDLHNIVAERFYGPDYTKEQRSNCKNMNFGVAYLQSAETFQEKHGIPKEEAATFIKWWWAEFPDVREWADGISNLVTKSGEVVSPFGHKRRFHLITKENRNASIREGINFLPQNIAANITVFAVCRLTEELDPAKANVILTVHDNIVSNVKEDYIDEVAKLTREIMVAAPKDSIGWMFPFETDLQVGKNWGELEDYGTA